ncbi:MAG TPA: hypothetical protein VGB83_09090 [Actinomycetota bacterium]
MRARFVAPIAAGALAAVLIVATSGGSIDRMTFGDGSIHRYVASHLDASAPEVPAEVAEVGASLRYGRIGLPALLFLASGGSPRAMRVAQPLLMVLAAAAAAAAVARLFPGRSWSGLLAFLVPGFVVSLLGGYAEPVALAFALWGIERALGGRWIAAASLFAAAILTKETAGAFLIGSVAWAVGRKEGRRAAAPLLALVPVAGWYAVVRSRFGSFPPLDPYLTGPTALGTPLLGPYRSIVEAFSTPAMLAAALHLAAGLALIAIARRSVFAASGAVASLQLVTTSPWLWRFVGDGFRTSTFIHAGAALGVVALVRPGWALPAAVRTGSLSSPSAGTRGRDGRPPRPPARRSAPRASRRRSSGGSSPS